jgi:hypothetical protein
MKEYYFKYFCENKEGLESNGFYFEACFVKKSNQKNLPSKNKISILFDRGTVFGNIAL